MPNNTVYLNGQYLPLSEAKISVLDRGFLFGDGIYEVIPVYAGKLFHFAEHIARLQHNLAAIRLETPHSAGQWQELISPLLHPERDECLYLQVTRGAAPKRDHAFPDQPQPTVFAMTSPIQALDLSNGVKAITLPDSRWQFCNIKATTLLANVLFRQQAADQGCAEAILIKDGLVTEGAASNIFAVIDQVLTTPLNDQRILPGITRQVILGLAKAHGIPVKEQDISIAALKNATEVWATSSIREIVPIVELDQQKIAEGRPGPLWQTVNRLFQDYKKSLL